MKPFLAEGAATVPFSYPGDLALYLPSSWPTVLDPKLRRNNDSGITDPLPPPALLERLLATCYQASLMVDERRPITFRILVRAADRLKESEGPPEGLHRLVFASPRPFTPQELARLAPAIVFGHSLVGVEPDEEAGFRIWGVIHSGTRWLQEHHGGRRPTCPLPPSLVVQVTAPGTLEVNAGSMPVARLEGGHVLPPPPDLYSATWLPVLFQESLAEIIALHDASHEEAARQGKVWGRLDPLVIRLVIQQMVKRLVATIRESQHGGLLVILSPEDARRIEEMQSHGGNPPIRVKYLFQPGEARNRFRTLILSVLAILAESHPECAEGCLVGWPEYQESMLRDLATQDEAILELSYGAAGYSAADGAVLMNKRFEILGFGAEIASNLPLVPTVAQALDAEGEETLIVTTDAVGTRHRAAYRIINEFRDALAVIVSQDGEVRFSTWNKGRVTYWSY